MLDCEDGIDEAAWDRAMVPPARTTTVTLDLDALPAQIAESLRAVLEAHDLVLCRYPDTSFPLDPRRLDDVLREAGRNASQVVVLADVESEAA